MAETSSFSKFQLWKPFGFVTIKFPQIVRRVSAALKPDFSSSVFFKGIFIRVTQAQWSNFATTTTTKKRPKMR